MKPALLALPCLLACVHASSGADPMRPLIAPAAASAASSAQLASPAERALRERSAEAPREPERLVAIRQDGQSRWLALFGERWVGVGDKLERYTVGAIDANTVQLAEGRQRKTLNLLPPLTRPAPNAAPPNAPPLAATRSTDVAQANVAAPSPHRAAGLPTP